MEQQPVEHAYESALHSIDDVELLCAARAFPGCEKGLRQLEEGVGEYLRLSAGGPCAPTEATPELLRALLPRLRTALESRSSERVCAAAQDLRDELTAHHRARLQATRQ